MRKPEGCGGGSRFPLRRSRRLVFVEESGFNTSMRRLRARAPRGKRAYYGKVPRNRGAKNTTLIAAITLEGVMGESITVEGATDAEVFEAYVEEHFVAPSLCTGQVVVLDRLGAHRRTQKVRELVEARGADLVCSFALLLLAGSEPHRGSFQ